MNISFSRHTRESSAFTLAELLLVLVVLSVLIVTTAPSLFQATSASRLTTAGDLLLNRLSEAQQQAVASNSEVEIRFFEREDVDAADPKPRLRSFQMLGLGASDEGGATSALVPLAKETRLESGVVVSGKSKVSSLLDTGFKTVVDDTGIPRRYLSLRFLSDGSTNLPSGHPWFLTLAAEDSEDQDGVPANFYTIQVDPVTGGLRSFRP